jgi:hypothetical protein
VNTKRVRGTIGESGRGQDDGELLSDDDDSMVPNNGVAEGGDTDMEDPCVPRGLRRMLDLAGDDPAVLLEMIAAADRIIARRNLVVESDTYEESTERA